MGRKGLPLQEADQDSEEDTEEDSEEEAEEVPRRPWQGIEAIFEAYQEHIEGRGSVRMGARWIRSVYSRCPPVQGGLSQHAKTLIFLQCTPVAYVVHRLQALLGWDTAECRLVSTHS